MSNDMKFSFTDAQMNALNLLGVEDSQAFINSAVQASLIAKVKYERKSAEDKLPQMYADAKQLFSLYAPNTPVPAFGTFKMNTLAKLQEVLDELGYKPNARSESATETEAMA